MEMRKEASCHYNMNNDVIWSNQFTHTHTHARARTHTHTHTHTREVWISEWHLVSMSGLTQGMTSGQHAYTKSSNDIWSARLYWLREWHLVSMSVPNQWMTSGQHVCTKSVNNIRSVCLYWLREWHLVSMSVLTRGMTSGQHVCTLQTLLFIHGQERHAVVNKNFFTISLSPLDRK